MRRAFREALVLVLIALVPAMVSGAFQLQWEASPPPLQEGEVSVSLAKQWGENVLWVDARTRSEFERKSVFGAVLLNAGEWDAQVAGFLNRWDPDHAIVVYDSGSGDSAINVAHRLREELKIEGVWVLQGGWDQWNTRR